MNVYWLKWVWGEWVWNGERREEGYKKFPNADSAVSCSTYAQRLIVYGDCEICTLIDNKFVH